MSTDIEYLLEHRVSANHFDPDHTLGAPQIARLVDLATRAPTAFNLQNWHFVAVHSAEAKSALLPLCYGQQKVADAAVTFVVCGTLDAHRQLAGTLRPAVDAGIVPPGTAAQWTALAGSALDDRPRAQRDEAIRSASLAAMTLMLAAQGMGLASCPMTGFDVEGVRQALALDAHTLPVLLVSVGRPAPGNWPQKPRKPIRQVLTLV